ncbi:unnamed protein product [Urochloa humidicola]
MRRVRVSSHHVPVHKLGDAQMVLMPPSSTSLVATTPAPHSPAAPAPDQEEDQQPPWNTPLIPGLLDDAALSCLLRLPVAAHSACRLVCCRRHHLLADKARFFAQHRVLGLHTPRGSSPLPSTAARARSSGRCSPSPTSPGTPSWSRL